MLLIMYEVGMSYYWIIKDGYNMQNFLVLLVTMSISLCFAISQEYSMFTHTYDLFALVLRFVMIFIATFVLVVLSIVSLYFAHLN